MKPVLPRSLLAMLFFTSQALALTLTNGGLETRYNAAPTGLLDDTGKLGMAMGGGFLAGLLMFVFWKVRRDRRVGCLVLLLALAQPAPRAAACANIENETLENSYDVYTELADWFAGPVQRALIAEAKNDPHTRPNPVAYADEPPAGIRGNDEAVRMVLKGDAGGALEMLKGIEREHPGLYATAANMGTCYELLGDDGQALHWIEEGLKRNPYSHMLAEWLHVRVLEAKIALKADPAWLDQHTITGLDPAESNFKTSQGMKDTEGVLASLRSQCTVRALFIKPQDPMMGQLLYEAATFMLSQRASAVEATLALAVQYGLPVRKARELQELANIEMGKLSFRERPSSMGIWLFSWKYPLIFLLTLSLGFVIPLWWTLKRENGD